MRLPRTLAWPIGVVRHRLVERPLWRWWHQDRLAALDPAEVRDTLPYGKRADWLERFGSAHRERFGWGPEDRTKFLDRYVPAGGDAAKLIEAADAVVARRFEVLGSGPRSLGTPIDWHLDFKSGHRFPKSLAWRIDYRDMDRDSDVKVPWELARFHFGLVLAQAYWVTGEERYAETFRALATEWLDDDPPGIGVHWACPMELALRATNLAYAFAVFRGSRSIDEAFWTRLLSSLLWHGRVIRANLEYGRRLGNHFIADCAGLVVLGHLFGDTREGRRWARFGTRALETQMQWQVHPDGVSHEKSISYHRLVLELFLVAFAAGERGGRPFSPRFRARLEAMLEFTRAYSREDGSTPLLSDADDGRVLPFAPWRPVTDHRHVIALGGLALGRADLWEGTGGHRVDALWVLGPERFDREPARRAPRSDTFAAGGYFVMRGGGCHTFLDAGPLGFEGDLVHGHFDSLSMEVATPAGVMLSDSGCYAYTADPAAYRAQVSTRAHNTVTVDGQDQAELLRLWRIRRDDTSPRILGWEPGAAPQWWEAEHHGYARLPGGVIHRRRVEFDPRARRWVIVDSLLGEGRHEIEVNWHAALGVSVGEDGRGGWELRRGDETLRLSTSVASVLVEGWIAPTYGVRHPAPVIRVTVVGRVPLQVVTTLELHQATFGKDGQI